MFKKITVFGWEVSSTGNIPWTAGWVDEKGWQIQAPLWNGYKNAYDWLRVWVDANHPSFWNCIIDTSDSIRDGLNLITKKIIEEAITTTDPDIIGISSMLDAEDEKNSEGMCNIDHEAAYPYTIHTAVLPKPSLIDANINSAIMAMLDSLTTDSTANIKKYFDPARNDKSLELAMSNGPFGTMTLVQSDAHIDVLTF